MSTNFANLAYKSTGSTIKRTFAAHHSDVYNVKDWGAVGDGSHDDRPNIQAAMDYLFPLASTVGGDEVYAKGSLYFPPGNYRCSTYSQTLDGDDVNYGSPVGFGIAVLTLNYARRGALLYVHMFGDNSATTRIFYDGTVDTTDRHTTTLFNIDVNVQRSRYEGLHFDMTPSGAYNDDLNGIGYATLCAWNRGRPWSDHVNISAGQNNIWNDCKFTGATFGLGLSGESAALGSETLFQFCKFDGNARGLVDFSSNGLGYQVIGGYCKNNDWGGVIAAQGVFASVMGMEFSGNGGSEIAANHLGDIFSGNNNPMYVCGCTSTSNDFVSSMGSDIFLVGNYHNSPSSTGRFIYPSTAYMCVLSGNYVTDSLVLFNTDAFGIYLRSNRFDNSPNHLASGGNSYVNMPYRANVKEPVDPYPPTHSFDLTY